MEKAKTPKDTSKVKLKVVKKKIHMSQRKKGLNRSNGSFNSSLNASTKVKQTLRSNNRALAHALQVAKQDLALASDIISSLRIDNRNMMLDAANNKFVASQCVDEQVGARLKPVLMMFKQKVLDVDKHLNIVVSTVQEISESISCYLSTSATNSRPNSLDNRPNIQDSPKEIPTSRSSLSGNNKSVVAPKRSMNPQVSNELSLIAESESNMDLTFNTLVIPPKVDENQQFDNSTDKPKTVAKNEPKMKRRSSNEFRRQSLDEIDFGAYVSTSRKRRRSSFFSFTSGLNVNLPQRLSDTLHIPVINGSCTELNLENLTERDSYPLKTRNSSDSKMVKLNVGPVDSEMKVSNEESIPCVDAALSSDQTDERELLLNNVTPDSCSEVQQENSVEKNYKNSCESSDSKVVKSNSESDVKTSGEKPVSCANVEPELVVEDSNNLENDVIPNCTIYSEIDMELTAVIDSTNIVNVSDKNLAATNEAEPADIDLEKLKDVSPAKETFVKPETLPRKKKTKCNTRSIKSSKEKKEDKKDKIKETDVDENKTVIELRLPKPGKIVFSATRKNFSGIRRSPPKPRSRKKVNEKKKEKEEVKSLFDFHDKTPQFLNKKDSKDDGIYNVSLNDSTFGKCQNLGEYRERVALAKEKKEEVTDLKNKSEKVVGVKSTVSRGSNESRVEKIEVSKSRKSVTDEYPVNPSRKSRSRKKIIEEEDESFYKPIKPKCDNDSPPPVRTMSHRSRSKVNYIEINESFDTSVVKEVAKPEVASNCEKVKTLEFLNPKETDGGKKECENIKITPDSEMLVSNHGHNSKSNVSKRPKSGRLSSQTTTKELHTSDVDKTQKHLKKRESVSSIKPSSCIEDIQERYRKALMDDNVSPKKSTKRRGRSTSQIERGLSVESDPKNAKIAPLKLRSRSASVKATRKSSSHTNDSNSVDKTLGSAGDKSSPILPKGQKVSPNFLKTHTRKGRSRSTTRKQKSFSSADLKGKQSESPAGKPQALKTRGRSRSRKEKIEDLLQEFLQMTNMPVIPNLDGAGNIEQENVKQRTPKLIKADDISNIKHTRSKGTKKLILTSDIKENVHSQLTDLTAENISTNKISPKRLSEDNPEDAFGVKRPRRGVIKTISYREPSLILKLRQGDELVMSKSHENDHVVSKDELKKRCALENLTNKS